MDAPIPYAVRHLERFGLFLCLFLFLFSSVSAAEPSRTEWKNLSYYSESALGDADDYQKTRCLLDVSAPPDAKGLPVVVWFHGGGLSGGNKTISPLLKEEQFVLVGVGYRLTPKAKFPDFLEDAAAAVAWTFANIERYGGDPEKIVVGGHSAGAYLSAMIGFDPRWLKPYELKPSRLAGLILMSGQMTTHFNVRKILNYPQPELLPIVDENAPLHYLSADAPPIALILGDRKIEWPARVEENELMYATLRAMKHPHVEFHENLGFDHGGVGGAPDAARQMKAFIEKVSQKSP